MICKQVSVRKKLKSIIIIIIVVVILICNREAVLWQPTER